MVPIAVPVAMIPIAVVGPIEVCRTVDVELISGDDSPVAIISPIAEIRAIGQVPSVGIDAGSILAKALQVVDVAALSGIGELAGSRAIARSQIRAVQIHSLGQIAAIS